MATLCGPPSRAPPPVSPKEPRGNAEFDECEEWEECPTRRRFCARGGAFMGPLHATPAPPEPPVGVTWSQEWLGEEWAWVGAVSGVRVEQILSLVHTHFPHAPHAERACCPRLPCTSLHSLPLRAVVPPC